MTLKEIQKRVIVFIFALIGAWTGYCLWFWIILNKDPIRELELEVETQIYVSLTVWLLVTVGCGCLFRGFLFNAYRWRTALILLGIAILVTILGLSTPLFGD